MANLTDADIDARILGMIEAWVVKFGLNPSLERRVAENATRIADARIRDEWQSLLGTPWPQLRERLRDKSERGNELRQNAPFYGILTDAERVSFFQR